MNRKSILQYPVVICVLLSLVLVSKQVYAQTNVYEERVNEVDVSSSYTPTDESPQMWEFELRTGFWIPHNAELKQAFTKCCNLITKVQGGLLFNRRYGVGISAGFLYKSGQATITDSQTGTQSAQRLHLFMIPMELNFTWRADYFSWRYIVPYLRPGFDWVYYKESISGSKISGMKFGMHGAGGLMLNLAEMSGSRRDLDHDMGINDFFLTLEGAYQWIDSFGKKGLDVSGYLFSFGLLFEF
ncbi:MAG: outer membrane beta-barrel protein [Deltaproteobacteria bacterium]|jgi:hypothetical protein|nr:outer membrane beta-barrel protein [Deltaproteobacteria bacterium]